MMSKTYYLVDTRTGKAGLKSESKSFLEGMVKAMQYPNWVVMDTIPESDDLAELTPQLPDEYWHSMNKD